MNNAAEKLVKARQKYLEAKGNTEVLMRRLDDYKNKEIAAAQELAEAEKEFDKSYEV